MEGIGQYVTQRSLAGEALPVDLLQDESLPEWSLGTRHTGLGISLAVWTLETVDANDPDRTVAKSVERFVSLCERCTRPGYIGMAIECLGAAMVVWVESTPGESRITNVLEHRPHPTTPELAGAWEALVKKPCVHALTQTYPLLKKAHRLDELFHYPLPDR